MDKSNASMPDKRRIFRSKILRCSSVGKSAFRSISSLRETAIFAIFFSNRFEWAFS